MQRLVFATRNQGKARELAILLEGLAVQVVTMDECGDVPEVIEDGDTFLANATKKAREVSLATRLPALADDSGLEVDALGGAPGVRSARYAGEDATDVDNNVRLLRDMQEIPEGDRTARFRSVVALADVHGPLGEKLFTAAGSCEGRVLTAPSGTGGFGYDPLFHCTELGQTFAEAGIGPKGGVSHRARAIASLLPDLRAYLQTLGSRS